MKLKTFLLIDAINKIGFDNGMWNIYMHLEKINTKKFYGTDENGTLESGTWISVYEKDDETFPLSEICKPDKRMRCGEGQSILFYNVD